MNTLKKWLTGNLNLALVLMILFSLLVPAVTVVTVPATPVYAASGDWQVSQSNDDAGGRTYTAAWFLDWTVNPAGGDSGTWGYYSGQRFQAINIPNGYTITTAYITYTSGIADFSGADTKTRFFAEDVDDAAVFSTSADMITRLTTLATTATVTWDSPTLTAWTADNEYQSPELKTIIQEIVDRVGWSSGNDLVMFWSDYEDRSTHAAGNRRYAYTWDSAAAKAPTLHIEWAIPAPTVSTQAAQDITKTTATSHGTINSTDENATMRGFQWGLSTGSYSTNVTESGSFGTGAYSLSLTGLPADDEIFYRAYAENVGGEGFGDELSFNTLTASAPGIATDVVVGYGSTYMVGQGTVVAINNTAVTEIGIEWGLTDSYGNSQTEFQTITSNGESFTVRADGLPPASKVYYRMKAKNTDNLWGYGDGSTMHTHGSYALYEYWNTSDDADVDIYGNNWFGQSFTTGADMGHTVAQARAKLFIVGSPGTLHYEIYRTSAAHPTGLPIASGSINADALTTVTDGAWYTLTMDEAVTLSTSTMYVLVLSAPNGDASNKVSWRVDTGNGYASGAEELSTDGGVSWSTTSANDLMFEIWGEAAFQISGAHVFTNFLEEDDRLVVFLYDAIVGSPYEDNLPQGYFNTQLRIGSTVIGQGKLSQWGRRPGSLYFKADEVNIPWGGNSTKVDLAGISGTDFEGLTAEYSLVGSDWLGQDLNLLDDWVIATAHSIENYYSTTITADIGGVTRLNSLGSSIFKKGIPGLEQVRPKLFSLNPDVGVGGTRDDLDDSFKTSVETGYAGRFKSSMDDIGTLMGVDGEFVGGGFWGWTGITAVAVVGVPAGGPFMIAAALMFILVGVVNGAISINWLILPAFLLTLWLVAKFTIWRT